MRYEEGVYCITYPAYNIEADRSAGIVLHSCEYVQLNTRNTNATFSSKNVVKAELRYIEDA